MKKKLNKEMQNSEGVWSKNEAFLESLAEYCIENPELRGWQAVINWAGFDIAKFSINGKKITYKDLFYEE
jgi:hypothetical protein